MTTRSRIRQWLGSDRCRPCRAGRCPGEDPLDQDAILGDPAACRRGACTCTCTVRLAEELRR